MRRTPPRVAALGVTLSIIALAWGGVASEPTDRPNLDATAGQVAEFEAAQVLTPSAVPTVARTPGNC